VGNAPRVGSRSLDATRVDHVQDPRDRKGPQHGDQPADAGRAKQQHRHQEPGNFVRDELVMEKYGGLLTEKTREATRETAHQDIVTVLEARFGDVPQDLAKEIALVVDGKQLKGLVPTAASCLDLDVFRGALARS